MRLSERLANSLGLDDFNKRHQVAFVLLCVAFLAIVSLWVVQLRKNISDPLHPSGPASAPTAQADTPNSDADLKAKDTDGDGLNDWDERNIYKTSPYLGDTDSDGFNDKQEVDSNNDPNCPRGQQCTVSPTAAPAPTSAAAPSPFQNPDLSALLNASDGSGATVSPTAQPAGGSALTKEEKDALIKAVGNKPSAATLRSVLLQAGMDKATLDGLTDADILATFQQLSN